MSSFFVSSVLGRVLFWIARSQTKKNPEGLRPSGYSLTRSNPATKSAPCI